MWFQVCIGPLVSLPKFIAKHLASLGSEIGAAVKVVDSHPCGWSSIPGKAAVFSLSL